MPDAMLPEVGLIASEGHLHRPAHIPVLDTRSAHVWQVSVPDRLSVHLVDLLAADELAKMQRYRAAADAQRFATGRAALRMLLGHYLDRAPRALSLDHTCRYCGGSHGKPRIDNDQQLDFNISASGQLVLIAVARACTVGVDVEATQRSPTEISALVLAPSELQAFAPDELLQIWCCKEAVLKAIGLGLAIEPRRIVIGHHGDAFRVLEAPQEHAELLGFSIARLEAPSGYAAAIAVSPTPTRLHLFTASPDDLEQLVARCRVRT